MDMFGPLPYIDDGSQLVAVKTVRYLKMDRAVPVTHTTVPHLAVTFMGKWVIPYGIRTHMLTDSGPQFVGKFCSVLCAFLGTK